MHESSIHEYDRALCSLDMLGWGTTGHQTTRHFIDWTPTTGPGSTGHKHNWAKCRLDDWTMSIGQLATGELCTKSVVHNQLSAIDWKPVPVRLDTVTILRGVHLDTVPYLPAAVYLRGGSTHNKITWVRQRQHHKAHESARERMLSLASSPLDDRIPNDGATSTVLLNERWIGSHNPETHRTGISYFRKTSTRKFISTKFDSNESA